MKTYMCDICKACVDDVFKCVKMREIEIGGLLSKKRKIHICKDCWHEIAEKSRKKRSESNG